MYCRYCGKELPEEAKFCPSCGAKLVEEIETSIEAEPVFDMPKEEKPKSSKVWDTFATIGMILGIINMAMCLLFAIGFKNVTLQNLTYIATFLESCGVPAIILSVLGKKSLLYKTRGLAGTILGIISVIVEALLIIIYLIILVLSYEGGIQ